jgi:hypothetical protein
VTFIARKGAAILNYEIMSLKELLIEGTKDSPDSAVEEILEQVYFIRKKTMNPKVFQEEMSDNLLSQELKAMHKHELAHLEGELNG